MNWTGSALITAGTDLNRQSICQVQQADISLDLTHTDATFYYELLDNVVDLDLGLLRRLFDGEASSDRRNPTGDIESRCCGAIALWQLGVADTTTGLSPMLQQTGLMWTNLDWWTGRLS